MNKEIVKHRDFLKTSVAAAALVALTSCSSRSGVHDSGLEHGQARGVTANTSGGPAESPASGARLMLRDNWQVQTSGGQPDGKAISKPGFAASGWYSTAIPATVSGVLAESGKFPDPFFGMNLRGWPGRGASSSSNALPSNPFSVAWWFRTEFNLPAEMAGRAITLDLEGVNYRAEVWLNGERITDTNQVVGAMRRFVLDITKVAQPGKKNALALRIQGQGPKDLGHTWVDWAPMPPDKMQGLWRDVFVTASGVLRMHDPFVRSRLSTNLDSADVIVSMDLENTSDKPVTGVVAVTLDGVVTKIPLTVAGGTTQKVSLDGKDQPGLHLTKPRLWWPVGFGAPEMYSLHVGVTVNNKVSDKCTIRFGVREVTSELTSETNRLYFINHHPILIRGAGWARNLFFMETPKREEQEMRLVHDMGLNAVRFEGKIGSDHLLDLADENGVLVIPGFCCCDYWEQWSRWDDATKAIAVDSLRNQFLLLRNHPSILTFWYGSDKHATPEVESEYLKIIAETEWPNPTVASAGRYITTVGPTGVKMDGPYDYEPPSYWYGDHDGAAFGFATEIGTGKTLPSIEDMRRMLGDDHLWPADNAWTHHSQGGAYNSYAPFNDAIRGRYGEAANLNDYMHKGQLIAYDDERALVTLKNPGSAAAFFVRLRVLNGEDGTQILPSMWSDNYVSLLPGETRTLTARWRPEDAPEAKPAVVVDGWNVVSN